MVGDEVGLSLLFSKQIARGRRDKIRRRWYLKYLPGLGPQVPSYTANKLSVEEDNKCRPTWKTCQDLGPQVQIRKEI